MYLHERLDIMRRLLPALDGQLEGDVSRMSKHAAVERILRGGVPPQSHGGRKGAAKGAMNAPEKGNTNTGADLDFCHYGAL